MPNTDGLVRPSEGVIAIKRSSSGGGSFDLSVNINPLIVLTKVGGSVAKLDGPDMIKVIDGSGVLNPLGSVGGQWAETPHKSRRIESLAFASGGTFFAGLDRASGEPVTVDLTSGGLRAQRKTECAILA